MIKYRQFIEENFLIDLAKTGQLVPFKFNPVQEKYYEDLVREYDIEKRGINVPIRENILKARREGFSSLILALFAADDLTNENPTQTDVLSYKDDATQIFRQRYRTYVLSFFAKQAGKTTEEIQANVNILEDIAPYVLSVDSNLIEMKHNQAKFQCSTASARVGGRGGVRHKILFSEIAFYPDTPKVLASEMIEATMRQVDIDSGWIFCESTENGIGTYQHKMWSESKKGRSRFRNRFYGTKEFYDEKEIAIIKSEYVDMDSFRRDYPADEDDLFKGSAKNFVQQADLYALVEYESARKELAFWMDIGGDNYIDQAETFAHQLETLARHHAGHALYAGLDLAKSIDRSTLTVLKDRRKDLSGGVKAIVIDTTNGDFMADWFEKNTSLYVIRVRFSRPSKSLMYTNLQVVIADKLTSLPLLEHGKEWVSDESMRFAGQMLGLEKEIKGNLLVVAHPHGSCNTSNHEYDECPYHDDYPDSWALAEHGYVDLNGVPDRPKKPSIPTVPNAIEKMLKSPMAAKKQYGTSALE